MSDAALSIDLRDVKSSNIKAVGYDADSRTLAVQFHSGATWHYADVSPDDHAALVGAESVGKHFHKTIRPAFKATKVEPQEKS